MCGWLSEGHWDERPESFHIEVDYASKDIIMQDSFWNKGVKVRNWSFPKKGKSSVWYFKFVFNYSFFNMTLSICTYNMHEYK